MENKSDSKWRQYLIVSLYTLNAPVRADYGEMEVFPKYNKKRTGNELIWKKTKPEFVFRVYRQQRHMEKFVSHFQSPYRRLLESGLIILEGLLSIFLEIHHQVLTRLLHTSLIQCESIPERKSE